MEAFRMPDTWPELTLVLVLVLLVAYLVRSEERRVGKECRSRWSAYHSKKTPRGRRWRRRRRASPPTSRSAFSSDALLDLTLLRPDAVAERYPGRAHRLQARRPEPPERRAKPVFDLVEQDAPIERQGGDRGRDRGLQQPDEADHRPPRRLPFQIFFFKQKTAYEIGLGIPAEPLFRSVEFIADAINNVFRKFSAFHDETGRLNVDGMNIISNDGSNKLNRSRKARVSYKVQRTINASLNAATSTRAVSSNPNFVTRQKIEIIFG